MQGKARLAIRAALVSAVSFQALLAGAALAQEASTSSGVEDIVVTAQRQAQSLQDVPIAVSAVSAEALAEKQINNSQQLQFSLPNVTFAKTNFTSSSFTIRGVGDLCVGVTCDQATAIHLNDMPLFASRIFETEFFDMERVEVLRGPQGTLFGRNATGGVVNLVTAKPDATKFGAAAEGSYGNFNEVRLQGMVNIPLTDRLAVRFAGSYINRDGYTENLYNDTRIDGRNMYALRGSLRWEPTDETTVDLMGSYFREDDDRLRIQKQMCQRDPTGVLGCLPGQLQYGVTNANATIPGVLGSRELLRIQGGSALGPIVAGLGIGSLYGKDAYADAINPSDPRQVYTAFTPTYFADEVQIQGKIEHDFGGIKAKLSGQWQRNTVDSQQDYNLAVQSADTMRAGFATLAALSSGAYGPLLAQYSNVYKALLPNGAAGQMCASQAEPSGTGVYGGHSVCANVPLAFDRSVQKTEAWTAEGIVSSDFDGRFNFLVGAIYNKASVSENSYYVNSFGLDYVSGVLGVLTSIGQQAAGRAVPAMYLGTPFYRNNTDQFDLDSWGLFGEAYVDITDSLKLTAGLRYNDDKKYVRARTSYANFGVPFGTTDAFDSPYGAGFDADPATACTGTSTSAGAVGSVAGCEAFQERTVHFKEVTGRAVLNWRVSDDNMLYLSYARGYKSGGINPPLSPIFAVSESFDPEFIDAFEIGSKNRFLDGTLQLNLTGFFYKYQGLQLARIVARTSVNDNVDAHIYGVEAEAIARPIDPLTVNVTFSYLKTEVSNDKYLSNPRDPSGGRSDAVIIKDISNASNCAVVPKVAGSNAAYVHVATVNSVISSSAGAPGTLHAPTAFPTDSGLAPGTMGAFSICAQLQNPLIPTTSTVDVYTSGVPVNIKGNALPMAPELKISTGIQWTQQFGNAMSIVPRFDIAYTGQSYGDIFNGAVNRIPGYVVMNAQVQLNGPDSRWYLRAYVQNIANNSAITALYVTDASSGLYTNTFTLEPRRYGLTAGVKF